MQGVAGRSMANRADEQVIHRVERLAVQVLQCICHQTVFANRHDQIAWAENEVGQKLPLHHLDSAQLG